MVRLHIRKRRDSLNPSQLISLLMILVMIVGAALIGIVLYSARIMDRNTVVSQQQLIDQSLTSRIKRSVSELQSVAWWDEAVDKTSARHFDREWIDLELGQFMTESYHHDRVMILDEGNQPIYSYADGAPMPETKQRQDLALIGQLVAQTRGGRNASPRLGGMTTLSEGDDGTVTQSRQTGAVASSVIRNGSFGELATVMAITPSVDMSLLPSRPRLLVSFITLNGDYWKQTANDLMLEELGLAHPDDKRTGTFQLQSDDKLPVAILRWNPPRPGLLMLYRVLPGVLVGLAGAVLLLSIMSRRLHKAAQALAEREAAAQHIANHDALTGLPNRRMLQTEAEIRQRAAQATGTVLAFACLDLDRFKDINDTLGHPAGDELIRGIAARLRERLAPGDLLARLGGDEFAVLRTCHQSHDADDLLQRIIACGEEPFRVNDLLVENGLSVGMTLASSDYSYEVMMREADIALFEAKATGRGRAVCFEAGMAKKVEDRHGLEVDLRKAIERRALSLVYQPIVDAGTGNITGVEALVRWHCARRGFVPPDIFVPIAEDAGLMASMGRLILEQAISDSRRWPGITTAINVSAAQLRTASFINDIMEPMRRHGVSPRQITLEITESVLMKNDDYTMRILKTLKDEGIALALDDFGTGYSSLAYLRDFPFDKIKIDKSFVKGVDSSERTRDMFEMVVKLGHLLGKQLIAEGVETEAEMQVMQATGCTHLQGYLFSRPVPADHVETMILVGRLGATRGTGTVAQRVVMPRRKLRDMAARFKVRQPS